MNDLLDYIDEKTGPIAPTRPSGYGITIGEYQAAKSCSRSMALRILGDLERAGVLSSTVMRYKGHDTRIYHKPK